MPRRPPKPPLTHFICIPLVYSITRPALEKSLTTFRNAARELDIPESAVRPVGSLHLTVGVMSLQTPGRIEKALEMLQTVDIRSMRQSENETSAASTIDPKQETSIDTVGPIKVSLESLHSMHAPQKTSILFTAPVDTSGSLLNLCSNLRTHFTEAGLMVADDRPMKLHATVLNTIYTKHGGRRRPPMSGRVKDQANGIEVGEPVESAPQARESDARGGEDPGQAGRRHKARANLQIDATSLLEHFNDHAWTGNFELERIALCKMGAKKILDAAGKVIDEAYEEVGSAPLPTSDGSTG